MSRCDNCGQEGFALAEEHSVNPEYCPDFIKRKANPKDQKEES